MSSRMPVFGNSGADKSTYANCLVEAAGLAPLDLATLAWEPGMPPQRKSCEESWQEIERFMTAHDGWVIEGC